jgi:hypothetical protein
MVDTERDVEAAHVALAIYYLTLADILAEVRNS